MPTADEDLLSSVLVTASTTRSPTEMIVLKFRKVEVHRSFTAVGFGTYPLDNSLLSQQDYSPLIAESAR